LPPPGTLLEVDGSTSLESLAEHFAVPLPGRETRSLGGVLAERAGRIPVAGDRFTVFGLDIDVLQAGPTRVERLLVRRAGGARIRLDREVR
jgi:CBS domain containing-hemolysin-like protein